MLRFVIICLSLVLFSSCKRKAVKVYPQLAGTWNYAHWCQVDGSNTAVLVINSEGSGKYTFGDYITGGYTYEGKAKIKNDELYVDGNGVFGITEVKDTVGYIYNPGPSTWCSPDSILVSGLIRTNGGWILYRD